MSVQRYPGSHAHHLCRAPGLLPHQKGLKCHFRSHSTGWLPGATEFNASSVQGSKLKSLGGWATTQNGFAFTQFPLTGSPKRAALPRTGQSLPKRNKRARSHHRAEACIGRMA